MLQLRLRLTPLGVINTGIENAKAICSSGLGPAGLASGISRGTDGSQLTAKGLPTPNLSTAEHNLHSPLEYTCLEEMLTAVDVLVELAQLWEKER